MVYKATTQRTILLFFLILMTLGIMLNRDYPEIYFLLIPFSIFNLASIFLTFKFRITNFNPEKIYGDLIDFANKYEIAVSKTKDYLILEKLK